MVRAGLDICTICIVLEQLMLPLLHLLLLLSVELVAELLQLALVLHAHILSLLYALLADSTDLAAKNLAELVSADAMKRHGTFGDPILSCVLLQHLGRRHSVLLSLCLCALHIVALSRVRHLLLLKLARLNHLERQGMHPFVVFVLLRVALFGSESRIGLSRPDVCILLTSAAHDYLIPFATMSHAFLMIGLVKLKRQEVATSG